MGESYTLGMDAKIYWDDTPLTGTLDSDIDGATWTELTNLKDLTLNLERDEADVTTRANNGWKATAPTLADGSIEFVMQQKDSDTGLDAIRTAWINKAELAILCLDRARTTVGCQGYGGNMTVTNFSRGEPLADSITYNVTLKPSSQQQWYVKGS